MKVRGFEWEGKRVLVTGTRGFIAPFLCGVLQALGASVSGAVHDLDHEPGSACALLELNRKIKLPKLEITHQDEVVELVQRVRPHVVLHFAAIAQVTKARENPIGTFETNVQGTLKMLEACRSLQAEKGHGSQTWRGVEVFVCASSDHVFGDEEPPAGFVGHKEVDPLGYGGPYEASKAAMELAVRSFGQSYLEWPGGEPATVITRSVNCFGPGDTAYRRVIPRFLKSALSNGRIDLTCRLNGRQFIHIGDAVAGYILAASAARQIAQHHPPIFHFAIEDYAVNGSSQRWISIEQLAGLVKRVVGKHVVIDDQRADDWAPKESKIQALNCDRTKSELGWNPKWDLRKGIEELQQWYLAGDDTLRRKLLEEVVREVVNLVISPPIQPRLEKAGTS